MRLPEKVINKRNGSLTIEVYLINNVRWKQYISGFYNRENKVSFVRLEEIVTINKYDVEELVNNENYDSSYE